MLLTTVDAPARLITCKFHGPFRMFSIPLETNIFNNVENKNCHTATLTKLLCYTCFPLQGKSDYLDFRNF